MIPYGRQSIDEDDIRLVAETMRSPWLTTGPWIQKFEDEFATWVAAENAVAVSNGTAALHAAMNAIELRESDEVIVPAITFVATANAVVFQQATPVFADVDPNTLLICPDDVRRKITEKTRAIVAVDFAGQPCDYRALRKIADEYGLTIISDSCHALGAFYFNQPVGSLADLTCFSFHPVKPITTGEGGMITTQSDKFADRMRRFRSHGIDHDFRTRTRQVTHRYDMVDLGFNYRLTDIQAALGSSQLKNLDTFVRRRVEIAEQYDRLLSSLPGVRPLRVVEGTQHAYHLYVIRIDSTEIDRDVVFSRMRECGIGVNVHYRPVYLNSFYAREFEIKSGVCPNAEIAYSEILSLPIFTEMTDSEILQVVDALTSCLRDQPVRIQPAA